MKKLILLVIIALAMVPQAEAQKPSRQKLGNSEFIAAVIKTAEGQLEIWLNTRDEWNERGALTDSYVEDGQMERADQITEQANLCNLMESTYEPCEAYQDIPQRTQKEIMLELQAIGVEIQPDFQAWAQAEVLK